MSPPKSKLKSVLSSMSPNSKARTIQSLRQKNAEKRKIAQRKLIYNKIKNLIKTAKELEKVNKKFKKLRI